MLGAVRCVDFEESSVPLVAAITGLTERTVQMRISKAHGSKLLRTVFASEWPWDAESLGPLTVAAAARAGLEEEISHASGLGVRTIGNRLKKEHGKKLLSNAFPELSTGDDDDGDAEDDDAPDRQRDGDRFLDGRSHFSDLELLSAVRVVSVRKAAAFIEWLAGVVERDEGRIRRELRDAHGRTLLSTLFAERFPKRLKRPPAGVLGTLTAAAALRSPSLVRWVADVANESPRKVLATLQSSAGASRVHNVIDGLEEGRTPAAPARKDPPATKPEPVTVPEPLVATGRIIDGRYQMGRLLGSGGFAAVYQATRLTPPYRTVVIKIEPPGGRGSLQREIEVADKLKHQHICTYLDDGVDAQLGAYIVLQHGGVSLEDLIAQRGRVDAARAVDVVTQIAAGLDFAHQKGVLHQDVKPANVLVEAGDGAWEVRIADFGIAIQGVAGVNTDGHHTVFATSPRGYSRPYASPEQLAGEKPRRASDQFSLGLVLCSMLEGKPLPPGYIRAPFEDLTRAQTDALEKALAPDPDDRFESCAAFARALRFV